MRTLDITNFIKRNVIDIQYLIKYEAVIVEHLQWVYDAASDKYCKLNINCPDSHVLFGKTGFIN